MARRSLEDISMKMSKSIWKNLQINSQRNLRIACKKCIPVTENANMAAGNTEMETTRVA